MKPLLGIIGGMGAAAGLRLAEYVISRTQISNPKKDSDFPHFLLYNLPSFGMDERGIADEAVLRGEIASVLLKLNVLQCKCAVIACNTVHHFISQFRETFNGTLVDVISAACDEVGQAKAVGVLCSESTKRLGLYEKRLSPAVCCVSTTAQEQKALNSVIAAAISGLQTAKDANTVQTIMEAMMQRGAEKIIVGCTEIPLVMRHGAITCSFLDSGLIAVDKALAFL